MRKSPTPKFELTKSATPDLDTSTPLQGSISELTKFEISGITDHLYSLGTLGTIGKVGSALFDTGKELVSDVPNKDIGDKIADAANGIANAVNVGRESMENAAQKIDVGKIAGAIGGEQMGNAVSAIGNAANAIGGLMK